MFLKHGNACLGLQKNAVQQGKAQTVLAGVEVESRCVKRSTTSRKLTSRKAATRLSGMRFVMLECIVFIWEQQNVSRVGFFLPTGQKMRFTTDHDSEPGAAAKLIIWLLLQIIRISSALLVTFPAVHYLAKRITVIPTEASEKARSE